MRAVRWAALAALAALVAGCAAPSTREVGRPLLDGDHLPDVLVEGRRLELPPAIGGNRFLTGWRPRREGGRMLLAPAAARARLQIAQLGGDGRVLHLRLAGAVPAGRVEVRAAGRRLGAFALAAPLAVPLPADLPLGRVNVDLDFPRGLRGAAVVAAEVRPSLPAGAVAVRGKDLEQSGDSLVDLVRPRGAARALRGSFLPPAKPHGGQRFELIVACKAEERPRPSWSWSAAAGQRAVLPFRVRLCRDGDFVRVRLLARGSGPPARWQALELVEPAAEPAPRTAATRPLSLSPPRLVVLYVMDALRADRLAHHGETRGVFPHLDALARQGTTFQAHRSVASHTLPATKALLAGRLFGGPQAPLDDGDGPTLAEELRARGYRSGLFSANPFVGRGYGTARGFEHVVEVDLAASGAGHNDSAARLHAAALEWLAALPAGERAFVYLHTLHPHDPYDPPEPFRARFARSNGSRISGSTETLLAVEQRRLPIGPADRERLRGLYDGGAAYNDEQLASFLAAAAAWAPPRQTVLAVTADHGEELFDHGGMLHGWTLYEEVLRVPWVLWAPGRVPAGEKVTAPTDTLDVHAALLRLAGGERAGAGARPAAADVAAAEPSWAHFAAAQPSRDRFAARSSRVHFASAALPPGGVFAATHGRWKLAWAPRTGIHWGMGANLGHTSDPEYLFDLAADPAERRNLAGDEDLAAAWLRSRLLAWATAQRRLTGSEATVDEATRARLRALGYVR